ncbi:MULTISPECIES: hypothetical protein [Saccharomonospora]|nr:MULTISPECIES: hypothetical protein [Saccharomonospora]
MATFDLTDEDFMPTIPGIVLADFWAGGADRAVLDARHASRRK